jgi:hypothetical protein
MEDLIMFEMNDKIQLAHGAKFISGNAVADAFIGVELKVADIAGQNYVVKTIDTDKVIGTVMGEFVQKYVEINPVVIKPYHVLMTADNTAIHAEPNASSEIVREVPKHSFFKIVNEIKGWGKLEIGKGWVNLKEVKVIK